MKRRPLGEAFEGTLWRENALIDSREPVNMNGLLCDSRPDPGSRASNQDISP